MLHIVGAGFLGSLFLEEWLKRQYALETFIPTVVVDFDDFEERNAANQNVTPQDAKAGIAKVDVMAQLAAKYFHPDVKPIKEKVTPENVKDIIGTDTILVSAVDNYETRLLLWNHALAHNIPLMHLGISQAGTGSVEWSWGTKYDTWPMSPVALGGKALPKQEVVRMPPCDLVGLRGLGINTGLAGAKSLGLLLGHDPEGYFGDTPEPDIFTTWQTTNHSHRMVEATRFNEEGDGRTQEVPNAAKV